ncbi:MAG: acyltransferase [Pirellulaceae bacterium]
MLLRACYKLVRDGVQGIASTRRRWILRMVWTVGRRVQFQGPVYVRSCGGKVSVGADTIMGPHVSIEAATGAVLKIGRRVTINQNTFIVARTSIEIGDHCLIGESVSIRDNDHSWRDPDRWIRDMGFQCEAVSIGNDVWIGRGASIHKGVTIGDGCVIGANAVVTKSLPAYSVAVGVPARIIKKRGDDVEV